MTAIILLVIILIIWIYSSSISRKPKTSKNQYNSNNDTFEELAQTKQTQDVKEYKKANEIKRIHNLNKEPSKEIILDRYRIVYFYHMTHKNNIKDILAKGLYSHNYAHSKKLTKNNIANVDVVNRRASKTDPIYHLSINDYAPLYFNPKNPMLFVKRDIEDDLVIIAFDRSIIYYPYTIFTDGNAANTSTNFYNSLKDLNKLNWDCINAKYWSDFPDGRRQRMAEVLVKNMIPNTKIRKLYCNNLNTLNFVKQFIESYDFIIAELNPSLFF